MRPSSAITTPRLLLVYSLTLLGVGATSLDAQTQVTVKSYHEVKAALAACKSDPACAGSPKIEGLQSSFTLYLKGTGDGFVWANAWLEARHRDRLYCAPEKLGMDADNYDQILESFLPTMNELWKTMKYKEAWRTIDDLPIGLALLSALVDAFPCAAGPKQ